MLSLAIPLKKSATRTPAIRLARPASVLRSTLFLLLVGTPVLRSLLPGQEANYFLNAKVGDHAYAVPAYCETLTATLSRCTPIGTLPVSAAVATPLFDPSSALLECAVGLNGAFSCARFGHSEPKGG